MVVVVVVAAAVVAMAGAAADAAGLHNPHSPTIAASITGTILYAYIKLRRPSLGIALICHRRLIAINSHILAVGAEHL